MPTIKMWVKRSQVPILFLFETLGSSVVWADAYRGTSDHTRGWCLHQTAVSLIPPTVYVASCSGAPGLS